MHSLQTCFSPRFETMTYLFLFWIQGSPNVTVSVRLPSWNSPFMIVTLQVRGMYKDRHYKEEECNDDRCNKWKEGTGDGHYKWEQCKGNEHHTYGHYITLFAEQLTRTFEVLVIQGFLFYLILLLGSGIMSTPSNLSPADRRAVIPRSQ